MNERQLRVQLVSKKEIRLGRPPATARGWKNKLVMEENNAAPNAALPTERLRMGQFRKMPDFRPH
jgi:hypothetical protein